VCENFGLGMRLPYRRKETRGQEQEEGDKRTRTGGRRQEDKGIGRVKTPSQ